MPRRVPIMANTTLIYLVALGVGAFVVYRFTSAAADGAGDKLGKSVGAAIDGAKSTAASVVDFLNPFSESKIATAKRVADAVNPTNPDNVFYSGFKSVLGAVTGSENVYDLIHGSGSGKSSDEGFKAPPGRDVISDDEAEWGEAMRRARLDVDYPNAARVDGERWGEQSPFWLEAP